MNRSLLVLALAIVGASADAQMGWRLPRVQQYFGQTGERQKFDPTRAKGIFQGRIFYSFHTGAYDVRVGFDANGTVGFIGWMKTQEDDGENPAAKFTEPEVTAAASARRTILTRLRSKRSRSSSFPPEPIDVEHVSPSASGG